MLTNPAQLRSHRATPLTAPSLVPLAAGVAASVLLSLVNPFLALIIPAAGIVVYGLIRIPTDRDYWLAIVLVAPILALNTDPGLSAAEIVSGLLIVLYMGCWYYTRMQSSKRSLMQIPGDGAVWTFILLLPLSLFISFVYGGTPRLAISEVFALSQLGLYFPIKEAWASNAKTRKVIVYSLVGLGVYAAIRNAFELNHKIQSAEYIYQILTGRVVVNDLLLMTATILLGCLAVHSIGRKRLVYVLMFLGVGAALVFTQSRAYWIGYVVAMSVVFFLEGNKERRDLLFASFLASVALVAAGLLFVPQYFILFVTGLVDRFASIGTAATQDLSLTNRWHETATVWELVKSNPILGHGPGMVYEFFDLTRFSTDVDAFVHNGFLSVWLKYGIWGLLLISYLWLRMIGNGFATVARKAFQSNFERAGVIAASATLVAILLTNITSNALFNNDSLFVLAVLLGIVGGETQRQSRARREIA